MKKVHKKASKITKFIKKHIIENIKAYIVVSIIMLIGIVLGVILANNMNTEQVQDIQSYLQSFTGSLKEEKLVNNSELLKKSLINNFLLVFTIWIVGTTVIGIPIVLAIVAFRGFCLGYTISIIIKVWGTGKGILFFTTGILLQNIIIIPCIIALAVSGIKLYKSIIKDKRHENIKIEIIRHTLFSVFILIILVFASFIETYMSTNLLRFFKEYF